MAIFVSGVFNALQQTRVAARAYLGMTKLTMFTGLDLATQLHGHGEHAVADAKHWDALSENSGGRSQIVRLVGAGVAARQDDAFGIELADEFITDVIRMQLAIHTHFTHAACDELRDLRTKIKDEDAAACHGDLARYVKWALG